MSVYTGRKRLMRDLISRSRMKVLYIAILGILVLNLTAVMDKDVPLFGVRAAEAYPTCGWGVKWCNGLQAGCIAGYSTFKCGPPCQYCL